MELSNDSNLTPPGFRHTDQYRWQLVIKIILSFFNLKTACDGNIWIQMPLASVTYVSSPPITIFF